MLPSPAALAETARDERAIRRSASQPLWPALLSGAWRLAGESATADRRWVIAHRSRPTTMPDVDRAILSRAISGCSNKVIALDVGRSETVVSRRLGRSLAALRLRSLLGAMWLAPSWAVRQRLDAPSPGADGLVVDVPLDLFAALRGLPEAEAWVLRQLALDKSYSEIAAQRGTSARTVGNQIERGFERLGVGSQRELQRWIADVGLATRGAEVDA